MKLHRLVMTNYRGIAHREIEFPDHGVVVVCGPNEVGKSSMIEAVDLLLESRDRSTKRQVKEVKPTHLDIGSEVTAEISTGPYRFVYRKRFHKRPETQLTMLVPRREQLTGDEAHERVAAMLAETLDTGLWRAQRVMQAASTRAVDLSGCDALSRALDVAAGDATALTGAESLLIERIDAEYARYFTATGRPTGQWAAAMSRLAEAEAEAARCAAAVAEVDDRAARHAELTAQAAELADRLAAADARHAAARDAADTVAALVEKAREAELVAAATVATSTASTAAHSERVRLCREVATRTATLAALDAEIGAATTERVAAHQAAEAADAAAEQAGLAHAAAEQRVDTARRIVAVLADKDEADRLSARLARIDAAQRDHDRVGEELAQLTLTEAEFRAIESAAAAVDRATERLASSSATVEFTAATDIDLVVDGERVRLPAGQSWSAAATAATGVEIPDVVTVRVRPGATVADVQAGYAAAQEGLMVALAAAGVSDLDAAQRIDQRRRELVSDKGQLAAALAALCGEEQADALRSRLHRLSSTRVEPAPDITAEAARGELDAAESARAQALTECEDRRKVAAAATGRLSETATRVTVLAEKRETQRAELAAVERRLTEQQALAGDEELAAAADTDQRAAQAADQQVAGYAGQLAAAAPDTVAAELAEAQAAAEAMRTRHVEVTRALHDVTVELGVFGTEGRQGKLDAAASELEHATSEHERLGRLARAADRLRSVMVQHRDATRLRYVEPFRAELQRLGAPVFGSDFEVDVDSDLGIRGRTLDGRTVPYDSLSGGAKEQLGILARIAGAALVAKEDTVPVLIDDALGFTDPDRLAAMGAVFDTVGAHGQVIVLTCTPDRYRGVAGAHHIELGA